MYGRSQVFLRYSWEANNQLVDPDTYRSVLLLTLLLLLLLLLFLISQYIFPSDSKIDPKYLNLYTHTRLTIISGTLGAISTKLGTLTVQPVK